MAEEDAQKTAPEAKPKGLWGVLSGAMSSPWMLAILAAVLGAVFQELSWRYQNNVDDTKAAATNARGTVSRLTQLANERFSATSQLVDTLKDSPGEAAKKAAQDRHWESKKNWEVGFMDLFSQIKFYVDVPFGAPDDNWINRASNINCTKYTLKSLSTDEDSTIPYPAAFLLAVLNQCFSTLDNAIKGVKLPKAALSRADLEKLFEGADAQLQHIWNVNNVLRCVIDGRAEKIHTSLNKPFSPFWDLIDLATEEPYPRPDETLCLRDYAADSTLGEASLADK